MAFQYTYESVIGKLTLSEEDGLLVGVAMGEGIGKGITEETLFLRNAYIQLDAYLKGQRQAFSLPFLFNGTPFCEAVWRALSAIPYGETRSYKQIAEAIGNPKACRAVGRAVHLNPLLIVVPCHRVIGSDRSLTGFSEGLALKRFLLQLEASHSCSFLQND